MKTKASTSQLQRELRRLMRSMDFVARHPALQRDTAEGRKMAEVYQQLGVAWEFLALQCKHRGGWLKTREGKRACKVCGLMRGVKEPWLLLPHAGKKSIGRKARPTSDKTFPNKKAARIVEDAIEFHGAKLSVDVHNSYRSRLFGRSKLDIAVAAERGVRLEEAGVEYWLDTHTLDIRLRPHKRGDEPPFISFVSELPRKALKHFPVMVQYDQRGRFVGVVIFKPLTRKAQRSSRALRAAGRKRKRN